MKEKIGNIIKELVRNEAISTDKLMQLAKKEGLNQKRITYVMRKAGVVEILGNGVYRVLIRDKSSDDYVLKATEIMEADFEKRRGQKKKPLLPGTTKTTHDLFEDTDHEVTDTKQEEDVNEMDDAVNALKTRIENMQLFLEDNIVGKDRRITKLEYQIGDLQSRHDKLIDLVDQRFKNVIEVTDDLDNRIDDLKERYEEHDKGIPAVLDEVEEHLHLSKRIANLEKRTNIHRDLFVELDAKRLRGHIVELENRINMCEEIIEDRLKEQTLIGNNNGLLKALHTLLGELI